MTDGSTEALFNVSLWDQLSLEQCEKLAQRVAAALPHPFRLAHIATHQVGIQRHHIAFFEWRTSLEQPPCFFALIPGGTVTLGYDRTQHLIPDEDLIRDWQENHLYFHRETVTIEGDLVRDILPANYEAFHTYLDRNLLPLRTVTLRPFLIETIAQEAEQQLPSPLLTYFRRKVDRPKPGYLRYVTHGRHHPTPQRHVVAFLKTQGFRLPRSDEWEYACAAGSRALFHWGNWIFEEGGMGQIPAWGEYLSVGENSDWVNDDLGSGAKHPRSNAFGLQIANHSYHYEYCTDPRIMRGGDGGAGIYGGMLAEALSLASAFSVQLEANAINNGVYSPYFRRVYDLRSAV